MSELSDSFVRSILSADAVGFSKLVSKNEYETLASLKQCIDIFSEVIESLSGRIFHSAGDSVFAEFKNSDAALEAAIQIQKRLMDYNKRTKLQQLTFRIGLDTGDVIADSENLLGEAVNFASRLESFAQPCGISVSSRFYSDLGDKKIDFKDHGIQNIKNSSIHAFDVVLPGLATRRFLSKTQKRSVFACAFLLMIAAAFAYYQVYFVTKYTSSSIAVLPFTNDTGDEALDYVASGLSNEVSQSIAKVSSLKVLSRSSVNIAVLDGLDVEGTAQKLGLDHLIHGTLFKKGNEIVLELSIFEADGLSNIMVISKAGNITDLISDRSKLVSAVLNDIDVPLSNAEFQNALQQGTLNIEAFEEFLKGDYRFSLRTPEDVDAAEQHFNNAIKIDPNFARPYGYLSILHTRLVDPIIASSFDPLEVEHSTYLADLTSRVAAALGPNIPEALFARSLVETFILGEHESALATVDTALSLKPSYADALALKASILNELGNFDAAITALDKAKVLRPGYPVEYIIIEAGTRLMQENWSEGKRLSEATIERLPEYIDGYVYLICADIALDNFDDALWSYEELLILDPSFEIGKWAKYNDSEYIVDLAKSSFEELLEYASF